MFRSRAIAARAVALPTALFSLCPFFVLSYMSFCRFSLWVFMMRRASYRQAVEWIRTRITVPIDPTVIQRMELAIFVAFLFDVPKERVAADIARIRAGDAASRPVNDT